MGSNIGGMYPPIPRDLKPWREAPPQDVRPGSAGAALSGVKGRSHLWGAKMATFEQFHMVKVFDAILFKN